MLNQNEIICPPELLISAQKNPPVRTAIVNAGSRLAMESAEAAFLAGLIEPVFFGNPSAISKHADRIGWDISPFEIHAADNEQQSAEFAARSASENAVQSIMKGDIHSDVFLRKLLDKRWALRTGSRLTHVFHMSIPGRNKPLLITDGAVNVNPDIETKKAIIINAANLAHKLGIARPSIALLSATEEPTAAIPGSIEARELSEWATENISNADVFGPLAFDLAVSKESANIKGVENPVAGNANIIVVPEIVSGNALFKMMVYFMGACAAGIVLGAKVPIILTSRADPPAARLASAALASIIIANP